MALVEIYDAIACALVEAEDHGPTATLRAQGCPPPGPWQRQMWCAHRWCIDPLRMERVNDPVGYIRGVSGIADMLELATAACRKMAARRRGMIGARVYDTVAAKPVPRCGKCCVAAV